MTWEREEKRASEGVINEGKVESDGKWMGK